MPYRVLPNGAIETDTLEEALAVQRASAAHSSQNGHDSAAAEEDRSDEAYENFWDDLEDNGKRFLKILANKNGEMMVTDDLAVAFKVAPKDLQRTTIHVRKMGERYKLEPFKTKKKSVRGRFRTMYWVPRSVGVALKEKLAGVALE